MGRQSTIKKLDPRIREAVDSAIRDGRATIADIVGLINEMGGEASASAVHRYRQTFEEGMEVFKASQEMARVWGRKLEDEPESDVAGLARQVLSSVSLYTAQTMANSGEAMPAGEVMFLAKALDHLSKAAVNDTSRILKIRQEVAKKAAAEAVKSAKSSGLSDEAAELIRQKILGVV